MATKGDSPLKIEIKIRKTLLLPIFFLLVGQLAFGEQYSKISISSLTWRMQQPTITSIYRDSRGLLWIGTQQGLYRFDGAELTHFNSDKSNRNSIPASDIRGIDESQDGHLLIATYGGGLLKWNEYSDVFEPPRSTDKSTHKFITNLVVSKSGRIWLGTKDKLVVYESQLPNKSQWLGSHTTANSIGQPNALEEDIDGNVYVASNTGLYKISDAMGIVEKINFESKDKIAYAEITSLESSSPEHLLIGTNTGKILDLNLSRRSIDAQIRVDGDASSSVTDLLFHDNKLWIGTNNGLTLSDHNLVILDSFQEKNSLLSHNHITSFFNDNNSVWIGTYKGLNILSFVSFETFNEENSGIFNDVQSFEKDVRGRLWIATYNGLFIYDELTKLHKRFGGVRGPQPIFDQRIMTIATKNDELWLGFRHGGVQVINVNSGAYRTPNIPNNNELEVTKILNLDSGDTWVGTYNQGLFRISSDGVESFLEKSLLPEPSISLVFELSTGGVLVGTENRIYRLDSNSNRFKIVTFKFDDAKSPPQILTINRGKGGDLWLGTKDHGLYIWTQSDQEKANGLLLKVNDSSTLLSNTIYGIEFDVHGNAWCSSQYGLVKFDSNGKLLAKFTIADGLQGNDFNFGASFTDKDGAIYFGGVNGYNRFNPNDVVTDLTPPKILLTSVAIPEGRLTRSLRDSQPTPLQLTHKDYFVTFTFSVLDFLDPDRNQFRYMLEGFDPQWIDNGTRNTATYTNLPAGDYVFRVQGANSAGVWNREGLAIDVRVLPPPWFSWWAYCLYSIVSVFVFWLLRRAYDSYAIEKRAAQIAVEKHETENRADDDMQEQLEMQDDLVKSVYRHNVATLALISDYISRQGAVGGTADESIKRVLALSALEECKYYQNDGLLVDLHKYTDIMISRLIKDATVPPEAIISINEVTTKLVSAELASPLSIAIYELLENSFQHAFEAGSQVNYVQVTLGIEPTDSPHNSQYRLTISDSGIGCPRNFRLDAPETPGFTTVSAITEMLSGNLHISTENGTSVTLVFPEAQPA